MRIGDDTENQILQTQQHWILGWVIALVSLATVGIALWLIPDNIPRFVLAYGISMALLTALLFEWDRRLRLKHHKRGKERKR